MHSKLIIKNLTKNFGEKKVLSGIDLQVEKGESIVILGGSGSGKSVLIKIVATLIQPSSGSIQIDGEEVANISEKRRDKLMEKFGFLFQGGALFDSLSVWENIAFRLLYHKKMNKKRCERNRDAKVEIRWAERKNSGSFSVRTFGRNAKTRFAC